MTRIQDVSAAPRRPLVGLAAPVVLVSVGLATGLGNWPAAVAGISATAGMWFYEDSFVRAGQSVPLS